ncbi:hypothetical protein [Leucobacter soli]|uniref:hypothetical protein n=1 Tax=Leucobacter soli TaxID=2812850 RepID=UPI00361D6DFB
MNPRISLWGSDLKRGTDATVTLDPGAETIATADAGRNRWVNAEADLPEGLAPVTTAWWPRPSRSTADRSRCLCA